MASHLRAILVLEFWPFFQLSLHPGTTEKPEKPGMPEDEEEETEEPEDEVNPDEALMQSDGGMCNDI